MMDILLSQSSGDPIYEQIKNQIKAQIISGHIPSDTPLPSIRVLAKNLKISVITTKRAYEELERDGFIVTMPGKGSFVAKQGLDALRNHQMIEIEKLLLQAIKLAKEISLSKDELADLTTKLFLEE